MPKRILIYGDSNAYGHIPAKGTRYPENIRWPGVCAGILGNDYIIIEDSISGRTTVFEDPAKPKRCGLDNLGYSLLANAPIDMLVIALGTNDLKFTDAEGSKQGLKKLIRTALEADDTLGYKQSVFRDEKRILLIGAPFIAEEIETLRPGHGLQYAAEESRRLTVKCREAAEETGCFYADLSRTVYPALEDCLHLSAQDHKKAGILIADTVRRIFEGKEQ